MRNNQNVKVNFTRKYLLMPIFLNNKFGINRAQSLNQSERNTLQMPIISVYSIKIVRLSCLLDIPPHIAQFSNTTVHFLRLKKLY